MLSGLSLDFTFLVVSLLDGSFETTFVGWDHKKSNVSLGSTRDHVLDEISVSWGIDNGVVIVVCEKFFGGTGNGDTSGTFIFGLVHEESKSKRSFSLSFSFLLQLGKGTVIKTSKFEQQVSGGGRFTGINVTNDDNT